MSDMFPNKQPPNSGQQLSGFNSQPQSFNPQPQSFNSQPPSFNSQPPSFSSQPSSLNSQQNPSMPLSNEPIHLDTSMMSNHNSQMVSNHGLQRAPQTVSNVNNNEEPMSQPKSAQPNMFKLQRNRSKSLDN